jgi:thiol-disulfide isomerase/thioredoxin
LLLFILSFGFVSGKDLSASKVITTNQDTLLLSEIINNDKATVMYFWATWCETCKKETPKIIDLSNEFPDVQFIPLSYASPTNSVIDYFLNKDYYLKTYIDYSGTIFNTFDVLSTPTVVIMDKNNKILFNGYKSKRFYKKLLNKLHS